MFKLYYSKIVIFTIIVILNCGIGAAFAEKMPINIDLSACKGKADCVWDFGNGTKVKGCSDKKHTFSKSGINEVSVVLKCSGLTQKTTRTFDVKSGIIDNVDHECRYQEIEYDRAVKTKEFTGITKEPDGAGYINVFKLKGEKLCEKDSFNMGPSSPVEDSPDSCIVDGTRYFAGYVTKGVGDDVGGSKDWTICSEPATESVETHHEWLVGNYEYWSPEWKDELGELVDNEWEPQIGCGNTTQTRAVSCMNKYNKMPVPEANCIDSKKPAEKRTVHLENACETVCKYSLFQPWSYVKEDYDEYYWEGDEIHFCTTTEDCECKNGQYCYYKGERRDDIYNRICRKPAQ